MNLFMQYFKIITITVLSILIIPATASFFKYNEEFDSMIIYIFVLVFIHNVNDFLNFLFFSDIDEDFDKRNAGKIYLCIINIYIFFYCIDIHE